MKKADQLIKRIAGVDGDHLWCDRVPDDRRRHGRLVVGAYARHYITEDQQSLFGISRGRLGACLLEFGALPTRHQITLLQSIADAL